MKIIEPSVESMTEQEKLDEIKKLLPAFHHAAWLTLADLLGMDVPKEIPGVKPLDNEWARLKELMHDVCGVEETPAKEIFKYRNAPCFRHPAPFSPEEAQYERLYRKNKLIIDGVPIRWGEPPCFTWCTKSNTPACQKIFNQQSIFTTGDRPKPIPKSGQQNLFD